MTTSGPVTAARDTLRDAGLRVTRPRLAVLGHVEQHPHSTVEEVVAGVRTQVNSVSTQAVYDILAALSGAGILRRMEPAGQAARYEIQPHDDHQHLVCRRCGRIEDVVLNGEPAQEQLANDLGYLIEDSEVTVWGLCPRCQTQQTSTPTGVETVHDFSVKE